MITTDALGLFALKLEDAGPAGVRRLCDVLTATVRSPAYRRWSGEEEPAGARCPLPPDDADRRILRDLGLADEHTLLVKVHEHRGRLMLTDGLWVPQDVRVFPFTDESELLLRHVDRRGYWSWPDVIVDPATGSGNHPVGSATNGRAWVACDVNPRALGFAAANALLHDTRVTLVANDIRRGLPPILSELGARKLLFVVNMPFGLSPAPEDGEASPRYLPLSSDGGTTGARLTLAALDGIHAYVARHEGRVEARAVVLCYSVGNRQADRWQIVERARELFGARRVAWHLQRDQTMWRINGIKAEPNPMNLAEALPKRANCNYYVRDQSREKIRAGYIRLAADLLPAGWDSLGYGILDIDLCRAA